MAILSVIMSNEVELLVKVIQSIVGIYSQILSLVTKCRLISPYTRLEFSSKTWEFMTNVPTSYFRLLMRKKSK